MVAKTKQIYSVEFVVITLVSCYQYHQTNYVWIYYGHDSVGQPRRHGFLLEMIYFRVLNHLIHATGMEIHWNKMDGTAAQNRQSDVGS